MRIIIIFLILSCIGKNSFNFNKYNYKINDKNQEVKYTLKQIFCKLLNEYIEAGKNDDKKLKEEKEEKEKNLKNLLNIYNPENAGGYFIKEIQDIIGKRVFDIEIEELLRLELIHSSKDELKNLKLNVRYKNWYELVEPSIENLEALIDLGLSIKGLNASGENLLHRACFDGDLDLVAFLLSKNLNINLQEKNFGFSPIFFACLREHKELLKYLYLKGANLRLNDKNNRNLLHVICSSYFNLNSENENTNEVIKHFLRNDLIRIILNFLNKDSLLSFIHEKDIKNETFYSYIINSNIISSRSYRTYISNFYSNEDNLNVCFIYFLIYYSEILGTNILDKLIEIDEESLIIKNAYETDKEFIVHKELLEVILENVENIESYFFTKYLLEKNFKNDILKKNENEEKEVDEISFSSPQLNKTWIELKEFIDKNDFDSFKEKLENENFDINYSLSLNDLYENGMTILHYAISKLKNDFIILILDKKPNIYKRITSENLESSIYFYAIKELVNKDILSRILKMLNFDYKLECLIYSLKRLNLTSFLTILESLDISEKKNNMSYIFNKVLENFDDNDTSFIDPFLSNYRGFIDLNYKKNKPHFVLLNKMNFQLFETLLLNFYSKNIKEVILDSLSEFENKMIIRFLSRILYDDRENSIAHLICEIDDEILLNKLLKNDIEVSLKNIDGKKPLNICEDKKSDKCKKLLIEHEVSRKQL